jgi:hypothetical protein
MFKLIIAATLVALVAGHGAVTWPPPRNAIDHSLAHWKHAQICQQNDGSCPSVYDDKLCPAWNHKTDKPGAQNGQSCFWFNAGSIIGCDKPDGATRGAFIWKTINPHTNEGGCDCGEVPCTKTHGDCVADGWWVQQFSHCPTKDGTPYDGPKSEAKATICSKDLRTLNVDAECGADDDWFHYTPWRAPGTSPLYDSCGVAGGHPATEDCEFGGCYMNTSNAVLGDMGSKKLPKQSYNVTWKAGTNVEVSWNIMANHGGGYQYRLCPADSTLDEECFQKTPLDFVGNQTFRWGGKNGKRKHSFKGTYATGDMVQPKGSMWAKNPVPRNDPQVSGFSGSGTGSYAQCAPWMDADACGEFKPHSEYPQGVPPVRLETSFMIDGEYTDPTFEIVDKVQIPADLTPGDYVLGWRWDCEESHQVWMSCSDITIAA